MENIDGFFYGTSTKVDNSIFGREGILGQIENLLKDKSERARALSRSDYQLPILKHSYKTDDRPEVQIESDSPMNRQNIYDEWIVDLHKINLDTKPLDDFFSKQKYEGVVLEVRDETFIARLRNLTDQSPDEEAEFIIEDLSKDDLPLLKDGAVFYWNMGYRDLVGGQRIACHMINFRRLPAWTSREIKKAGEKAESFFNWLASE